MENYASSKGVHIEYGDVLPTLLEALFERFETYPRIPWKGWEDLNEEVHIDKCLAWDKIYSVYFICDIKICKYGMSHICCLIYTSFSYA